VVRVGDVDFVLADLPGLIEGASEGAGLGTRFLGHLERCRVLLHLVDATSEHVGDAYRTVRRELKAYGAGLDRKKEIVALSKCDALSYDEVERQSAELRKAARKKPYSISAVSGAGMDDLLHALARVVDRSRAEEREGTALETRESVWQP
jgi:GTP-binding protein